MGLVVRFLVLPQVSKSSSSLHLLFDVDNAWIPFALLAELGSLVAYGAATRSMLPASRPSLPRVVRIDLSAIALGHCLPDGGIAGTALCWRLLVVSGVSKAEAGFAKLTQGLLAALVLQGALVLAYVVGLPAVGLNHWDLVPLAVSVGLLAVAVGCAAAATAPSFRALAARSISRLPGGDRLIRAVAQRIGTPVTAQLTGAIHEGRVRRAAAWALSNWVLDAVALWAALHAYSHTVTLEGLAIAFGVANTFTWLPITPGGIGLSEGVMIPVLMAFGMARPGAVLGVLTWRLVAYWLPIPLGLVAYATLPRRWRRTAPAVGGDVGTGDVGTGDAAAGRALAGSCCSGAHADRLAQQRQGEHRADAFPGS